MKDRIFTFLCSEVLTVQNPENPIDIYTFKRLNELVDVLIRFLKYPCEEKEIAEVGKKILNVFSIFSSETIDTPKLPGALEDLSTGFEGFLKKIAAFKYKNNSLVLKGDGINYRGLLYSSMGKLLEGVVAKINPRDRTLPEISAPIITFSFSHNNIRDSIYDKLRLLRNDIHLAPKRSIFEMLQLFRIGVASLLFAVEENLLIIRKIVDPMFSYLSKLKEDFEKWEHRYVEIDSEEVRDDFSVNLAELQVLEWQEELSDNSLSTDITEKDIYDDSKPTSLKKIQAINITDNYKSVYLIGEPGAGKSTTLETLAFKISSELLSSGFLIKPCPVLIKASQFDDTSSFLSMVSEIISVQLEQVKSWLKIGYLSLLIDGLNEVSTSHQERASREINHIISKYEKAHIVITSRKYGFTKRFNIPVFELLPMSNGMIKNYLIRNMKTQEEADQLFESLQNSPKLLEISRNPLILQMLTKVVRKGKIPINRGQIFKLFTNWILSREKKLYQTNRELKEKVLTALAFEIRTAGRIDQHKTIVLESIRKSLTKWNSKVDATALFSELLDNHILEIKPNEKVNFFHELVLEYFVALKLHAVFMNTLELDRNYFVDFKWSESVIMLSGLLDDSDQLINQIFEVNNILAARCISSGAKCSQSNISKIINNLRNTKNLKVRKVLDNTVALLELSTNDSFRALIEILGKAEVNLTRALSLCERPIITAIKLLSFGLSGHHRVFQCLQALTVKVVSEAIFNSDEVARAELILLSGKTLPRDLVLLNQIGIPERIKDEVTSRISNIIMNSEINCELWRRASILVSHQKLNNNLIEQILKKCNSEVEKYDGPTCYSLFVVCKMFEDSNLFKDLAVNTVSKCLNNQLYALAAKFIKEFNLSTEISGGEILSHLKLMAELGSIEQLLKFSQIYEEIDFEPFLNMALEKKIEESNISILLQYHEQIHSIAESSAENLYQLIIKKNNISKENMRLKKRTILKSIRAFKLEKYFQEVGIITRDIEKRQFGFFSNILTDETFFFHYSAIQNSQLRINKSKLKLLIRYSAYHKTQEGKYRRAKRINLL